MMTDCEFGGEGYCSASLDMFKPAKCESDNDCDNAMRGSGGPQCCYSEGQHYACWETSDRKNFTTKGWCSGTIGGECWSADECQGEYDWSYFSDQGSWNM